MSIEQYIFRGSSNSEIGNDKASNAKKSTLAQQLRAEFLAALRGRGYEVEAFSEHNKQELKQAEKLLDQNNQTENNDGGSGLNVREHPYLPSLNGRVDPTILPKIISGEDLAPNEAVLTATERAKNKQQERLEMAMKLRQKPKPAPRPSAPRPGSGIPKPRPLGA